MAKRIRHMGMTLTKGEHERWHRQTREMSPKQHEALMKRLGVTPEQDREWHRTHQVPAERNAEKWVSINPFAVGAGFLQWCVKQGWLAKAGNSYRATAAGVRELRERFDITI